jgi:Flp pilus assembly protein TadG
MAMILPILLGLAGGATDLARAYQAWLTVESATRNAVEYVATKSCGSDSTCVTNTAVADAKKVICAEAQSAPGYTSGSPYCTSPAVTATVSASSTATGATATNPIVTAQVTTNLQFRTLVPWPFLPNNTITLSSNRTYSVIYGR